MGMYTEVVVKIQIRKNKIGEQAFNILEAMFYKNSDVWCYEIENLPDHEFFKCARWSSVGSCSSFYHHPNTISDWYYPKYEKLGDDTTIYIFNRSDLKNYDNEIQKFFDWLNTLNLDNCEGDFIGYSLYKEDNDPVIYKYKGIK